MAGVILRQELETSSTDVLLDYDYHPPDRLQLFTIEPDGILRADDDMFVTEALHGETVLRHYAFADRWFKVNCTTDVLGRFTETGSADRDVQPFAFNCDIVTPMLREGDAVFSVDLWLDVLVREDGVSYRVEDARGFRRAVERGLLSEREARHATAGLRELVALIERGGLVAFLSDAVPFQPSTAPAARPVRLVPVASQPLVQPHRRPTWGDPA